MYKLRRLRVQISTPIQFGCRGGLLSNTQILQMDIAPESLISSVRARLFNTTFNRQIISAREFYGAQLNMPKLKREEILEALEPLLKYYAERDR